jgi:hypothetical protein
MSIPFFRPSESEAVNTEFYINKYLVLNPSPQKMNEIGHISREQIEFRINYDTLQLFTKKLKIDIFVRESINILNFSTQ